MSDTLAYIDMRIVCCKEDKHDHIGFRLEDIENIRAHISALEAELARKDGAWIASSKPAPTHSNPQRRAEHDP